MKLLCEYCSKQVIRKPSAIRGKVFCSRSCAATFNNKHVIKRKLTKQCKTCGKLIRAANTYCKNCFKVNYVADQTLQEAMANETRKANRYRKVRLHARKTYLESGRPQLCCNCGYDKHFEVCHIKDICDFCPSCLIAEINAPDNLIALCPNCHWELDHGHLKVGGARFELATKRL